MKLNRRSFFGSLLAIPAGLKAIIGVKSVASPPPDKVVALMGFQRFPVVSCENSMTTATGARYTIVCNWNAQSWKTGSELPVKVVDAQKGWVEIDTRQFQNVV